MSFNGCNCTTPQCNCQVNGIKEICVPFEILEKVVVRTAEAADDVNHPKHYTSHPSGVECITITRHHNFAIGNAIKYLFRAGLKHPSPVEDLKKAIWYIQDEIKRIEK